METRRLRDITVLCLAFFYQISLKLLILSIMGLFKFAYFFELLLEGLSHLHLLHCHLQELIFVFRVLDHCLHWKRVCFDPIGEGEFMCIH
jgi:hypothetical protein